MLDCVHGTAIFALLRLCCVRRSTDVAQQLLTYVLHRRRHPSIVVEFNLHHCIGSRTVLAQSFYQRRMSMHVASLYSSTTASDVPSSPPRTFFTHRRRVSCHSNTPAFSPAEQSISSSALSQLCVSSMPRLLPTPLAPVQRRIYSKPCACPTVLVLQLLPISTLRPHTPTQRLFP